MTSTIFTTLGQTILDDIQHPLLGTLQDVVGGSGTYATLGARIALGPSTAHLIAFLLRTGPDFPPLVTAQLSSWGVTLPVMPSGTGTFRGTLTYHDAALNKKSFFYTNPPSALVPATLPRAILGAEVFHVGPPAVFSTQMAELLEARQQADISDRPLIVWEPSPSLCREGIFEDAVAQAEWADVISPNHVELAMLSGEKDLSDASLTNDKLEILARDFIAAVRRREQQKTVSVLRRRRQDLVIVVRAAERGCFTFDAERSGSEAAIWIPAYHENSANVVDATGGGNSFLGGFAIEYQRTGNAVEACLVGSATASFAIEQIGLPVLAKDARGDETWNGHSLEERLVSLQQRAGRAGLGRPSI